MKIKKLLKLTLSTLIISSNLHAFHGGDFALGVGTGLAVESIAADANQGSGNEGVDNATLDHLSDRVGELQSELTSLKEERREDKRTIKNLEKENERLRRRLHKKSHSEDDSESND